MQECAMFKWLRSKFIRKEKLSKSDWLFLFIQLGAALWIWLWWFALPSPGYSVGVLAVLAAVMSVHGEMPPFQKVFWLLLIAGFLFLEFRAIDWDRANNDAHEALIRFEERDHFREIMSQDREQFSKVLQQNQEQFNTTLGSMRSIAHQTDDVLTGGDSYVVIAPTIVDKTTQAIVLTAEICPRCKVRNSIPNAKIELQFSDAANAPSINLLSQTIDPNYSQTCPQTISPPRTGETTYKITVFARNKITFEYLTIRFNNKEKRFEFKYRILRQTKEPHFNIKTGLAEGEELKLLVDEPWDSRAMTPLNPDTTIVR
jgi:hypothetical protein